MVERTVPVAAESWRLAWCGLAVVAGVVGLLGVLIGAMIRPPPARTWTPTPCTVISSEYGREPAAAAPYVPRIRYAYKVGDTAYEGASVYLPERGHAEFLPVQRLLTAYPAGTPAVCYVNPADPRQAVLCHRPPWVQLGALAVAAGLVVLGGGGLLVHVLGRRSAKDRNALPPSPPPTVLVRVGRAIRWAMSLSLLCGGLGLYLFFFNQPLRLPIVSQSWAATPATVVASGVQTRTYPWGQFYRVDVLYEYEVAGQRQRSNGYGPSSLPTTRQADAELLASAHPVGQQVTCFAAPHDPAQAILNRGVTPVLVLAVFPLFLTVAGLAGIWSLLGPLPATDARRGLQRPARELSLANSPLQAVVMLTMVTALWTAPAIPFIRAIAESFTGGGRPAWLPALFVGIYVAVGLVVAAAAVAHFLALFNARPRLHLTPGDIVPGHEMTLRWQLVGRTDRVSVLTISAVCQHHVRHGGASSSSATTAGRESETVITEVHAQELARVTRAADIQAGVVTFVLPPSVPPTTGRGQSSHVWRLRVVGEIIGWPDIEREFLVEVTPAPGATV